MRQLIGTILIIVIESNKVIKDEILLFLIRYEHNSWRPLDANLVA